MTKNGDALTGQDYLKLIAKGGLLDKGLHSANGEIRSGAQQARDMLDAFLQRNADPALAKEIAQTRLQWKNMRTVEPLIDQNGQVPLASLKGVVNRNFKGRRYDLEPAALSDLADVGQEFFKSPVYNTQADQRAAGAFNWLGQTALPVGAAIGAHVLNGGSIPADLVAAMAGRGLSSTANAITKRAAVSYINSPGYRNALLDAVNDTPARSVPFNYLPGLVGGNVIGFRAGPRRSVKRHPRRLRKALRR